MRSMTFSIVATDGTAAGVAVASKFLSVGSVVPIAQLSANGSETRIVGAVATQATARWSYRADVLRLLAEGLDAPAAVDRVTSEDERREHRQLGVVAPGEGYDGSGVRVDLRVDDHPGAAEELVRLLDLNDLYFGRPEDVQPLTGALADEVSQRLALLGHTGDVTDALESWAGVENYEMRLTPEGIDAKVLVALRRATSDQG